MQYEVAVALIKDPRAYDERLAVAGPVFAVHRFAPHRARDDAESSKRDWQRDSHVDASSDRH
jgi:hypothetical protein